MRRTIFSRFGLAAGALSSVFALGMGCISTENERTLELAVGTRCTLNSDCTDPNVCVFGTCHAECTSSKDCQHDERCVKGEKGGVNVCQLAKESTCATSADCSGSQVCGVDGECRDGCKATEECLTGQVCTQGTCADQDEVDPMTGTLVADPEHVGEGQPCTYNTDCPENLGCIESSCAYQCKGDKDCSPGQKCVDNFCKIDTPVPLECTNSGQCGTGFLCVMNECVPGCATDADCTIGTRCFAAECAPPVFDASMRPDWISANDASLLALYNTHILRCPNTGCTPANVETLFDTVYFGGSGAVPFGTSSGYEQLYADGPATFIIASNFNSYQEDFYGCRDLPCDDYVEAHVPGVAQVKTMRADASGAVLYQIKDEKGYALTGCTLALGSTDCVSDFDAYFGGSFTHFPIALAVKKGATAAADVVYLGWSDGLIQSFNVADCLTGSCSPTDVAQITDGIGLPVEISGLQLFGDELFFVTAEGGGDGGGYTYSISRCASSSCTAALFYQNHSFFYPQIAIGGGALFLADDGNVWKSPITTP